jgi:hypothetical protein
MIKVSFCPNCSNVAPQRLLHSQHCVDQGWSFDGEPYEFSVHYYVATCETCKTILLYRSLEDVNDPNEFTSADLVYPDDLDIHKSIPAPISQIYAEAIRIKNASPNGFAVQIRRALEAVCDDRGAIKGTLQTRIKDLSSKGVVPATLAEISDILRLLGNIGAHGISERILPWQVWAIHDFFKIVIEYVYVAPSKLREFKEHLPRNQPPPAGGDAG